MFAAEAFAMSFLIAPGPACPAGAALRSLQEEEVHRNSVVSECIHKNTPVVYLPIKIIDDAAAA